MPPRALGEGPAERRTIGRAQLGGDKIGMGRQLGRAQRLAQARGDGLSGCRNVAETVGSRIDAGRHRRGVIVAGLPGDLAFHQPARSLEVHHRDHRGEQ
jgi:hypothetical protein